MLAGQPLTAAADPQVTLFAAQVRTTGDVYPDPESPNSTLIFSYSRVWNLIKFGVVLNENVFKLLRAYDKFIFKHFFISTPWFLIQKVIIAYFSHKGWIYIVI